MRPVSRTLVVLAIVPGLGCGSAAWADVFVLASGGRVVGELLNPDETPRQTYQIKTEAGVQLTLARTQVAEWLRPRPEETEYEKIRPRYPDTVQGQWDLAEWCRQRTLNSQRETHLKRILELDPNHVEAHRALGHFQRDGKWTSEGEVRSGQGFVRYRGRWRLPQEIQLMEERAETKAAQGNWMKKFNQWRGWLGGNKTLQAYQAMQQVDDPFAVPALAKTLNEERDDQARLACIEALARIDTPAARKVLAFDAIGDPVAEVRLTCLDHLKRHKDPEIVRFFVETLRSADNDDVNLAAVALQELGDRSAVGPLIEALVTVHKQKIVSGNPGQISTTFGTGGTSGGGLSVGGGGPKIVTFPVKNQAVLDALISLTGVNYGFNVELWKSWYASRQRTGPADARRD